MNINGNSLPTGWIWSAISQVAETSSGGTPKRDRADYYDGSIPWVKSGELKDRMVYQAEETITELGLMNSSAKVFPSGTLCIALYGATVGKLGILGIDAATNQAVCGIFLPPQVSTKYIYHFLGFRRRELIELGKGGAQPNISQEIVRQQKVPIPPSAEQYRIVAKIEEIFTKLDAGVTSLKAAKRQLKRYRKSVLKAAVEGELTRDWREQHKDELEPASVLLERILRERRAKWEADQLARMQAQGKTRTDDEWKAKYRDPATPQLNSLPELPGNWTWGTFQQVSDRVTVGFVGPMKDEYVCDGIPFLRGQNVRENRYEADGLKFISKEFHLRIIKSRLHPNDLVVVRSGSVGISCVIPDSLAEANCSDLVIVKQPKAIIPQFGAYYMNSTARSRVTSKQVGMALTHFNTQSMAEMPVPIPPMIEQQQIVAEVERRLSIANEIEAALDAELKRAERLRQSILKRAFEGKLVSQDPNDEPASVLLERIKSERANNESQSSNGKRTARGKKLSPSKDEPMLPLE